MKGFKFNKDQLKKFFYLLIIGAFTVKDNKVVLSQDKWKRNLGEAIENEPYTLYHFWNKKIIV